MYWFFFLERRRDFRRPLQRMEAGILGIWVDGCVAGESEVGAKRFMFSYCFH